MTQRIQCYRDDALGHEDAVGIARALQAGDVSQREVIDAAIARVQQVNPALNALTAECFDQARQRAPEGGFFAGVPSVIKDNTPYAGLPTRHGSQAVGAIPSKESGPYARQYLSTGLTILGKSSLPEFGFNATTEPAHTAPTPNPWHTGYSAGGSSGGSAALVASGALPIAHANDGGGSIRIPAACCGLVGLKPTRGRHRVSDLAASMPINLIGEGVVTRSVRDTAWFHAEMERAWRNPKLPEIGLVKSASHRRRRIALLSDSITGHATDAATLGALENTARLLESNRHQIEPVAPPVDARFPEDFALYWSMLAFFTAKRGHKLFERDFDRSKLDGLSRGLSQHYRQRMRRTPMSLFRLSRTRRDYARFFENYDALLSPALGHTTPELGHLSPEVPFDTLFERLIQYVGFTPFCNAAGGPAITVPMGWTENGLPISVHIAAGHGQERLLLQLAYELEGLRG